MTDGIPAYIELTCESTKAHHTVVPVTWSSRKDERQEMREAKMYMCQHCMRLFEHRHVSTRHYSKLAEEIQAATA